LVVLSACHGLDGFEQGREGVVSLASSFFAAGVPTVVAALWQVDDRASYRLMTRFHELVSGGEAPSVALRAVMIEEIRSEDPSRSDPAYWAVFAVLGV
jgi:CHAT domain-containing protein